MRPPSQFTHVTERVGRYGVLRWSPIHPGLDVGAALLLEPFEPELFAIWRAYPVESLPVAWVPHADAAIAGSSEGGEGARLFPPPAPASLWPSRQAVATAWTWGVCWRRFIAQAHRAGGAPPVGVSLSIVDALARGARATAERPLRISTYRVTLGWDGEVVLDPGHVARVLWNDRPYGNGPGDVDDGLTLPEDGVDGFGSALGEPSAVFGLCRAALEHITGGFPAEVSVPLDRAHRDQLKDWMRTAHDSQEGDVASGALAAGLDVAPGARPTLDELRAALAPLVEAVTAHDRSGFVRAIAHEDFERDQAARAQVEGLSEADVELRLGPTVPLQGREGVNLVRRAPRTLRSRFGMWVRGRGR